MAGAPRFDLLLLGYRNDLARERIRAFLRGPEAPFGKPIEAGHCVDLPHRLYSDIERQVGLRLVRQLGAQGAHVRLVPAAADAVEPTPSSPAAPAGDGSRSIRPLLLLVLLLAAAAGYAVFVGLRSPLPPSVHPPDIPVAFEQTEAVLAQHHLNNEAVLLNAAGQFAEAAQRLRVAVEREPRQMILQRNLKIVLRNWAIAELDAGRPESAAGLLKEGLGIEEDVALLAPLGVAYARSGEWEAAQEVLEQAVKLGATDWNTLVSLGNVYRHQANLKGAVEMFQRARENGAAGPEFSATLEQLERELDAEWDFAELSSAHFEIAFDHGENYRAARVVLAGLEDAYFLVGRKLDLYPSGRTPVVLYPSEEFNDITRAPSWTGGIYDGRIKLPVRGLEADNPLLDRALRHEYAHVVVVKLSAGHSPVWLNEGVSIWAEEDHDGDRVAWAYDTIARHQLFSLRDLEQPFAQLAANRVPVAYAQSYLAVRAIIDRFGERRLRQLLTRLGEGGDTSAAFEAVFSTRLATFEAELLRQLVS